jgi:hypothetical protein
MDQNKEEDIKETLAYYGAAMHQVQVLEVTLANLLAGVYGASPHLRHRWGFDHDLKEYLKLTLGQMTAALKKQAVYHELLPQLEVSFKTRNWLTHEYFRDRMVEFRHNQGRQEMKKELILMSQQFEALHHQLSSCLIKWMEKNTDKSTREIYEELNIEMAYLSGENQTPPFFEVPERLPKEVVIIGIYHWDSRPTVLKTKEGVYLLLSDHGICFGPRDISENELSLISNLSHIFPAKTFPSKIKVTKPWDYVIEFDNNYQLWVKPLENVEGIAYKIGVRRKNKK